MHNIGKIGNRYLLSKAGIVYAYKLGSAKSNAGIINNDF